MTKQLDIDKAAKICARLMSPFDGERLAAITLLHALFAAAGVDWLDFLAAEERAETAEQAAKEALAEANYWRERVEELEHQQPDFQPLAIPIGNHRQVIEWLFAQHRAGRVWLSRWELQAFPDFARWVGNLRPAHRARLQRTLERVYEQTGLRPPS